MAKYYLTKKAVEDLAKIWNYTFEKWSEEQADKYYEMLIDNIIELSKDASLGRRYTNITSALFGHQAGKHIIFYRKITPEEIEITRILHEMMDLRNRMKE